MLVLLVLIFPAMGAGGVYLYAKPRKRAALKARLAAALRLGRSTNAATATISLASHDASAGSLALCLHEVFPSAEGEQHPPLPPE